MFPSKVIHLLCRNVVYFSPYYPFQNMGLNERRLTTTDVFDRVVRKPTDHGFLIQEDQELVCVDQNEDKIVKGKI